jgi:hypothetical protein
MPAAVPGSVRGYRWWRFQPGSAVLFSPYRCRVRWETEQTNAECLGTRRWVGWRQTDVEHAKGAPEVACTCGFYGLWAMQADPPGPELLWNMHVGISGGPGLILGVVEGTGRVLLGTEGWRAQRARVAALFVSPRLPRVPKVLEDISCRYGVPMYRNLRAIQSEWGPDEEQLRLAS